MGKRVAWGGVAMALLGSGCSHRAGKVASLRDALASSDASAWTRAAEGAPSCATPAGVRAPLECLSGIATFFGAKAGFHADPPDDASAAAAALVLVRDGRGDAIPASEAWLYGVARIAGPGADALRLGLSARMVESVPRLGRALDSDEDARALLRAVAASVPGACDTYALLGAGAGEATLPPQTTPDHSACVQKDLLRPSGPPEHARYGAGLWRAAAGGLALWRDAAAALHAGAWKEDGATRATVAPREAEIDAALAKVALRRVPSAADVTDFMGETHPPPPSGRPDASP